MKLARAEGSPADDIDSATTSQKADTVRRKWFLAVSFVFIHRTNHMFGSLTIPLYQRVHAPGPCHQICNAHFAMLVWLVALPCDISDILHVIFCRTVPSDIHQGRELAALVVKDFNTTAVLYASSEAYGQVRRTGQACARVGVCRAWWPARDRPCVPWVGDVGEKESVNAGVRHANGNQPRHANGKRRE